MYTIKEKSLVCADCQQEHHEFLFFSTVFSIVLGPTYLSIQHISKWILLGRQIRQSVQLRGDVQGTTGKDVI
jgi:hypothetical protein